MEIKQRKKTADKNERSGPSTKAVDTATVSPFRWTYLIGFLVFVLLVGLMYIWKVEVPIQLELLAAKGRALQSRLKPEFGNQGGESRFMVLFRGEPDVRIILSPLPIIGNFHVHSSHNPIPLICYGRTYFQNAHNPG
jgi:hypothetical protein